MSKVDLRVFEALREAGGSEDNELDSIIHYLAEGDLGEAVVAYNGDYEDYASRRDALAKEWDYELLEQEGGGEGNGEYAYGVFRLKGVVYKAEWSYYSYSGSDYDGIEDTLKIVKPVEKLVTVWE